MVDIGDVTDAAVRALQAQELATLAQLLRTKDGLRLLRDVPVGGLVVYVSDLVYAVSRAGSVVVIPTTMFNDPVRLQAALSCVKEGGRA